VSILAMPERTIRIKWYKVEIANSQRRKASTFAGTQSQQHRSQPAKELAFFPAWATVFSFTQ